MNPENPLLSAALEYRDRGWSVIPMKMAEKKPAVRWKKYQQNAAHDNTVRRWFREDARGLAVVFGAVSGGLVSRDFDAMAGYERWAAENPTLASGLPTVATHRGRHVYCRASPDSVRAARSALGKAPENTGALHLDDGELRAGVGCYSVLPPSMHPTGGCYKWVVPLPPGDLPEVDLLSSGFLTALPLLQRERRKTEEDRSNSGGGVWSVCEQNEQGGPPAPVELAITETLPTGPGQRHRQLFVFARALKGIDGLNDAPFDALKAFVQEWHCRALPVIRTKPFEESWIDFLNGWERVRFAKGEEPLQAALAHAQRLPPPPEAKQFDQQKLRNLVALCRELQNSVGDAPFFLSCRTAGELVGVSHTQANRWLCHLYHPAQRLLELVEKGSQKSGRASRYRYLGTLQR